MSGNNDYKVGYRRPPEHSRFKPGRSGNLRGRPPRYRNLGTVLKEALQENIDVTVNGHPRRMKRIDALVRTTVERALKNDPKATAALMVMMRHTGAMGESTEPVSEADLSAQDQAILESFLQRRGAPQQIRSDLGKVSNKRKRKGGGK